MENCLEPSERDSESPKLQHNRNKTKSQFVRGKAYSWQVKRHPDKKDTVNKLGITVNNETRGKKTPMKTGWTLSKPCALGIHLILNWCCLAQQYMRTDFTWEQLTINFQYETTVFCPTLAELIKKPLHSGMDLSVTVSHDLLQEWWFFSLSNVQVLLSIKNWKHWVVSNN